jgi:hypothetical protein
MAVAGTKSCGILVNLETVLELFSSFIPDHDDMVMDKDVYKDEDFQTPLVNMYLQAFLRRQVTFSAMQFCLNLAHS